MFIMDTPYIPAQDATTVLAQAESPGSTALLPDYLLSACTETTSLGNPMSAERGVDPAYMLTNFLNSQSDNQVVFDLSAIKNITLLQGTTHGKLNPHTAGTGRLYFMYDPVPGYTGDDRAMFMAEFDGKHYKIVVDLKVYAVEALGDIETCPRPKLIKVNGKPVSGSSGYNFNSISITFADLAGGALGQTTGTNIILDDR